MKPGAVLVDLAIEQGGNVEGAELGKIVGHAERRQDHRHSNLAATVPADASALYARNVLNFLALSLNVKTGEFAVPKDDEIVARHAGLRERAGRAAQRETVTFDGDGSFDVSPLTRWIQGEHGSRR